MDTSSASRSEGLTYIEPDLSISWACRFDKKMAAFFSFFIMSHDWTVRFDWSSEINWSCSDFSLIFYHFVRPKTTTKKIISLVHQPRDHSIYTWYCWSDTEAPTVPIGVAINVAKTKALISFAVTAKLICVFVFAYAKRWFSHDAAQLSNRFVLFGA